VSTDHGQIEILAPERSTKVLGLVQTVCKGPAVLRHEPWRLTVLAELGENRRIGNSYTPAQVAAWVEEFKSLLEKPAPALKEVWVTAQIKWGATSVLAPFV
jgi:hypothetical protein